MNRRKFLSVTGAGLATVLAGCIDSSVRYNMRRIETSDFVNIVPTTFEDSSDEYEIIETISSENETTTVESRVNKIENSIVLQNGVFYDIDYNKGEVVSQDYEVIIRARESDETQGSISFEELSDKDQSVIESVTNVEDLEDNYIYSEEEIESSKIIKNSYQDNSDEENDVLISYNDRDWIVVGVQGPSISTYRFEYSSAVIAESESEFINWVSNELVFKLKDLTEGQREIVDEAVNGGYYPSSLTESYEELASIFYNNRGVGVDETGGTWLVEYNDALYEAELNHPSRISSDS